MALGQRGWITATDSVLPRGEFGFLVADSAGRRWRLSAPNAAAFPRVGFVGQDSPVVLWGASIPGDTANVAWPPMAMPSVWAATLGTEGRLAGSRVLYTDRMANWRPPDASRIESSRGKAVALFPAYTDKGRRTISLRFSGGVWTAADLGLSLNVMGTAVAISGDTIVAAVTAPSPGDADVFEHWVVVSRDFGVSWSEPAVLRRPGLLRAVSTSVVIAGGEAHLVWIDSGREVFAPGRPMHVTFDLRSLRFGVPVVIPVDGLVWGIAATGTACGIEIVAANRTRNGAQHSVWAGRAWSPARPILEDFGVGEIDFAGMTSNREPVLAFSGRKRSGPGRDLQGIWLFRARRSLP